MAPSSGHAAPDLVRPGAPGERREGYAGRPKQSRAARWRAGPALPLVVYAVTQTAYLLAFLAASEGRYSDFVSRWDGEHYVLLAEEGYPTDPSDRTGAGFAGLWAFYPLFPALVRAVAFLTPLGPKGAAPLVSITAGVAAVVVLHRMVERHVGRYAAIATVVLVCTSMASPVLQMAYTESLALLLLALAFDLLLQRRYAALLPVLVLLSLSRPLALPFAVVVAFHAVRVLRSDAASRQRWAALAMLPLTVALAAAWPVLAAVITGQPRTYLDAMASFHRPGTPRSWLSWWLASGAVGWSVTAVVLTVLLWTAVRAIPAGCPLELRAWTACYPVYILAGTYISTSLVRYLLLAFPVAFVFGPLARPVLARRVALGVMALGGMVLAVLWAQRFVGSSLWLIP